MKMKYKSLQYQTSNPGINPSVALPNIPRFSVYPGIKTVNEAIPVNLTGSGTNSDLSGSMGHSLTSSVSSTNGGPLTPMTSLNPALNIDRINQPHQRNSFPLGSNYPSVVNNNTNQRNSFNSIYGYSGDQQQLFNYQQQSSQQVNLQSSQQVIQQPGQQQVNLRSSQQQYNQQVNQQFNQQQYTQQVNQQFNQQQCTQQVNQQFNQQQYNQQPSQQVNLRSSQQQYTQQFNQQQYNQQQTNQQVNQQQYNQQQTNQQYNQQQYNQQQYNQQQYNQQPGQQQLQPISIDKLFGRSIYSPYASMYPSPPILYDKELILKSFDFSKVPDYPKINFGITYEDSIRVSCIQ